MNDGCPEAAAPEKNRGCRTADQTQPKKKTYPRTISWNNLSYKLAIYQKLANFHNDDVWFFAGSLLKGFVDRQGHPSFDGSPRKCMKLIQIWAA